MRTQAIKDKLLQAFEDAQIEVASEDDVHFRVRIVTPAFAGLPLLQQHRLVYEALGERWSDEIHAIALETRAS